MQPGPGRRTALSAVNAMVKYSNLGDGQKACSICMESPSWTSLSNPEIDNSIESGTVRSISDVLGHLADGRRGRRLTAAPKFISCCDFTRRNHFRNLPDV